MKTFKNFVLDEATFMTTAASLTQDKQTGNYADPAVRLALNRLVGTVATKTQDGTMIPEQVVAQMRNSLSKLGLTFDEVPMMEGASGSFELPLTSFGGRFGKDENTPYNEFLKDDGISHIIEGGLKLNIQYEMIKNSSCKVYAKIM